MRCFRTVHSDVLRCKLSLSAKMTSIFIQPRRGYPRLQSDVYIFLQRCFITKDGFQASNHFSNNLYVLTLGYIVQYHARIHTVGDLLYWTA